MALVTLTQGHLKQLELCPRRFQYTYLEHLSAPTDPAMLDRQEWGTRFHRVMQQRELGLSLEPLLIQEPGLERAVQALVAAAPDLFGAPGPGESAADTAAREFRQSEHRRSMAFKGYGLTVIYDLVILTPNQAQIVDWKTYLHPPAAAQLAEDWQTRLYLYVLAETTDLAPEQLTMIYWFVPPPVTGTDDPAPTPPSCIRLPYSRRAHRRTAQDLDRLTDRLTTLLARGEDFPLVDEALGQCQHCPFAVRCQRQSDRTADQGPPPLPPLDAIAEVPL